ncbi:hypothetical protein HJFPF1_07476 [Paramyrothecium foliicola]|nr:hypothetical protein HJFPF1_07476 [Paramyrothecium foliicola]
MLQRWCKPAIIRSDFYFPRESISETVEWEWNISDLYSSTRGCRCCKFLLETLNASQWMSLEDDDFIIVRPELVGSFHTGTLDTPQERKDFSTQFQWGNSPANATSKYNRYYRPLLRLYRKPQQGSSQYPLQLGSTVILPLAPTENSLITGAMDPHIFHGRQVAAEVNIPLIQTWFRTCNRIHSKLDKLPPSTSRKANFEEDCMPKTRRHISHFRLIDVKKQCVFLAHGQEEYAALSYVWGHAKRFLLTRMTLAQLSMQGALSSEEEKVPQTFRDALSVARWLNIAYLWIDAVGVVQDEEEQLLEHMNAIDSIYSSAVLTIVSDTDSADTGIPGRSIRAFSGILGSTESKYGPPLWGVPQYCFARGITWSQSKHELINRRSEFPSWSWAGWKGNTGSTISFGNVLTRSSDIWHIDWHFYKLNKESGRYELTPTERFYKKDWMNGKPVIQRPVHQAGSELISILEPVRVRSYPIPPPGIDHNGPDWQKEKEEYERGMRWAQDWVLPDHPGEGNYAQQEMSALYYDSRIMPPLNHIIRFFTSCAKLFVDSEPDQEYRAYNVSHCIEELPYHYKFRLPSTGKIIGHIQLDPAWQGKGKEQEFMYISPSFSPPSDREREPPPKILWLMLVEGLEGAPEVRRRVQICGPISISTWRQAEPVWKCITMA